MNIFPDIKNAHWIHLILLPKSSFIETSFEELGEDKSLKQQNGSSILTLHETSGNSSHLHYIHQCPTWTNRQRCNCWFLRRARELGYKSKCHYEGKYTEEHWTNLLAYLQKQGKRTLSAFHNHESKLDELRHAFDSITPAQRREAANYFRCEYDSGKRQPSRKELAGSSGTKLRTLPEKKNESIAQQIYQLYKIYYWNSPEQAFRDTTFINTFLNDYYDRTETLRRINLLVYDQLQTEWKDLQFEDIMLRRLNDEFNDCLYYSNDYSAYLLCRLLYCQLKSFEKVAEFLDHVLNIMNKTYPKINTLNIVGPPGSGKTYFVETIGKLCWFTGRCDSSINKFTQFPFEHMHGKRMTIFNEFNLAPSFKDVVKEILEGANVTINIKYRPRCILERTPIIITTNNEWQKDHQLVDQKAFSQRMISYEWTAQPWLKMEDAYPHPPAIAELFHKSADQLKIIYDQVPEKEYLNLDEQPNYIDKDTFLEKLQMMKQ